MKKQWTIEPVTKPQAGREKYMALVAPNGRVFGMFYEPNIAKTVLAKINSLTTKEDINIQRELLTMCEKTLSLLCSTGYETSDNKCIVRRSFMDRAMNHIVLLKDLLEQHK